MPRMPYAEIVAAVADQVRAAGGTITHNDLVERLQSSGQGSLTVHLPRLSAAGDLVPAVKAQAEGAPVLSYTLPGAAPAPAATPTAAAPAAGLGE